MESNGIAFLERTPQREHSNTLLSLSLSLSFSSSFSLSLCLSTVFCHRKSMLKATSLVLRNRTAWRELLHPLPVAARHDQWLKRDTVELNEAVLRRPYYSIKSCHTILPDAARTTPQTAGRDHPSASSSSPLLSGEVNDAVFDPISGRGCTRRPLSSVMLPERLAALREQLNLSASGTRGPNPLPVDGAPAKYAFTEEYGFRLRPRYPQSWDAVPPDQPSRD